MESIKADVICPTVCYSCLMTTICTASLIFLIRLLLSMTDENVHSQNICLYVCTLMQSTWRGIITCFFYFSFSKWINLLIVFLSRDFNSNRWNGNIAECFCFQPRCPFLAIYIPIYGLTWNEHPSLYSINLQEKKVLTSQPETTEYMFGTATNRGFPTTASLHDHTYIK